MRQFRTAFLSTAALVAAFSVQSVIAADLAVRAPVVAPVSHWGGVYASFSAGASWTKANESFSDAFSTNRVSQFLAPIFNPETDINNTTGTTVDSQDGKIGGAVFTLTMGYNVVWHSWLAGIQSEVSLNRNNVRTQGAGQAISRAADADTFNGVTTLTNTNNSNAFAVASNLENKWTISEMARLGYLVTPDLLVYGLVGWSWGGFEWNAGTTPFTMNGFTWGAGVEKDFGWLRAFVQYKGIRYRDKDVDFSNPSARQNSQFVGPTLASTFSTTTADSAIRRFSADVNQVTAGITIPLNFR
jgi:opacity protein-like surface antigen